MIVIDFDRAELYTTSTVMNTDFCKGSDSGAYTFWEEEGWSKVVLQKEESDLCEHEQCHAVNPS